jgi:hypothetical protein
LKFLEKEEIQTLPRIVDPGGYFMEGIGPDGEKGQQGKRRNPT